MTLLATIDLSSASARGWDAIVIGAGPAGAMAARELSRRGSRTLLVERKSMPRHKVCGACLNARALSILDAVGLARLVEMLKGVPVSRFSLSCSGKTIELPLPGGVALSRTLFDAALVQSAIESGAMFLPQTQARVLPAWPGAGADNAGIGSCRQIELAREGEVSVVVEARVVVAADGLGHPSLQRLPEYSTTVNRGSRVGLGGMLSSNAEQYERGVIYMGVARAGYVGLVRLEDDMLNVAAAVDLSALRAADAPGSFVLSLMQEAALPVLEEATSATWTGTASLTRQSKSVAGAGIFLVGDAAGYVEPFTGEGMANALMTGVAVTSFVERALAGKQQEAERGWTQAHARLVGHRQQWCRRLSWTLRRPQLSATAIRALSVFPSLSRPVVRRLNSPIGRQEMELL